MLKLDNSFGNHVYGIYVCLNSEIDYFHYLL